MCVVCVCVCVCFCKSLYAHQSTINKYDQIFHSHGFGASEARLANLCIHMTNFNLNTIVAIMFLLLEGLSAIKNSAYSLVLRFDLLQCLNIQAASLKAELHWQMNNTEQRSDSYWNICTSADPGTPLYLEGWQLLTLLINQNYADCFELDSLISTQNCTQWLER